MILSLRSRVKKRFAVLMSRWTMPWSWAYCRPRADLDAEARGVAGAEPAALAQDRRERQALEAAPS